MEAVAEERQRIAREFHDTLEVIREGHAGGRPILDAIARLSAAQCLARGYELGLLAPSAAGRKQLPHRR